MTEALRCQMLQVSPGALAGMGAASPCPNTATHRVYREAMPICRECLQAKKAELGEDGLAPIVELEPVMSDRQSIPATHRAKVLARIGEFLDRAEAFSLAIGESHTIRITVSREESGGFTWASAEAIAQPHASAKE